MANSVTHFRSVPIYGAAYSLPVAFRKSDGTSLAPTSLDTELSLDNATYADATNEVTLTKEVGGSTDAATGYITLTAAEMTADNVLAQVKSANCVTMLFSITPRRIHATITGTATAGGNTSITLQAGSAAPSVGMIIRTDGGTGAGQARFVIGYDAGTRVATVARAWETNPSSDTTYTIGYMLSEFAGGAVASVAAGVTLATDQAVNVTKVNGTAQTARDLGAQLDVAVSTRLAPTVAARTLDVSASGEAGVDWANVGSPTSTVALTNTTVKSATDVETDTADIQNRLPAALVSGRIDASTGALGTGIVTAIQSGLATQADITAITQAQRVRVVAPALMERPDAGSITYRIYIYAYNEQHTAEDLDSNPTVTAENNAGTSRSSGLGTVTKPGATTGIYYVDYTVAAGHAVEGLLFKVNATEGTVTTQYAASSIVVDTTAVDFTSDDRTNLQAIANKLPTVNIAGTGEAATAVGTLNNLSAANVLAQVNAALNTAIPGTPTADSINQRLKALDDLLQANGTGDAAAIKTALDLIATMIEDAGDYLRWKSAALEEAPTGGGASLTAQDVVNGFRTLVPVGTQATGSYDEQLDTIQAAAEAASGAVGTGAKSVTIQVNDGSGNAVPNVRVTIKNAAQSADIGIQTTGANGATPSGFGLDPSTGYKAVLSGLNAAYTFANPYTVTTSAGTGAQTVTLVVTAATIPAPASADNYLLYGYERKVEGDAAFGASGVTVKVVRVSAAGQTDAAANACRRIMGTSYTTDAAGLWSFEIAKALADSRLRLQFTWTGAAGTQSEEWEATVDAAKEVTSQIAWADLAPTKK